MISFGSSITKSGPNSLVRKSLSEIYEAIKFADKEVKRTCEQLRQIGQVSKSAAAQMKRGLPFFSGSLFRQDHRKLELLEAATHFILDIDACYESEGQFRSLRHQLCLDQRVKMLFTSPGGQGLKLVFELSGPIHQPKTFSDAYKTFAFLFAKEHGLEKWLDQVTHDASRVSFLSDDPEAYYQVLCEKIDWKGMLKTASLPEPEELEIPDTGEDTSEEVSAVIPNSNKSDQGKEAKEEEIQETDYKAILKRLKEEQPLARPVMTRYEVPEELQMVDEPLREGFEKNGLKVNEVLDIHYGRKWKLAHGPNKAELNIYYGKRGYSVVLSPQRETHPDLNELARQIAERVIFSARDASISEVVAGLGSSRTDEGPLPF